MQVLSKTRQGSIGREPDLDGLIEVVDKHMPEVLAIDEIWAKAEALAHLLERFHTVTLRYVEARCQWVQKTVLGSKTPSNFETQVEMRSRNRFSGDRDRTPITNASPSSPDFLARKTPVYSPAYL